MIPARALFRSYFPTVAFFLFPSLLGCGRGINSSLSLLPSNVTLSLNEPSQMHLMLIGESGSTEDITSLATWEVSTKSASIAQGLVRCQQSGKFQIRGVYGPLSASATVSCVGAPPTTSAPAQPTVVDLRFENPQQIVRSEKPYTFSVMADYSDGSSSNVSSAVTWTGTSSVAYISSAGTAFCNTAGDATITAQLNSQVITTSFTCILKRITPAPGFAEHAQQFDGPFPSWINVKTVFGAKGDGKTDDTQAFQNALDSLTTHPAVLWIPQGTYVITASLHLTAAQQFSIIGEDSHNTLIEWHGPVGGTMMDLEGCTSFRLARLAWDGLNAAAVVLGIDSTLTNGEGYPTFDDIEDQKISRTGIGLLIGFAGETSVQRVHFDQNTVAGISLQNWNALNFNVVDSLFTDCNTGVTNGVGEPIGSGAFNVSNSIFVRSQTADMSMGNTGPFSERQNISLNSKAFFIAGRIGAGANIILQANTIITPLTDPIQIGNPGPIMLIDNHFIGLDPSLHILNANGYNRTGVFSMGNEFAVTTPFTGYLGLVTSLDEGADPSDPGLAFDVPTDVYTPAPSGRPVFEIPPASTSSVIQQIVDEAAAMKTGAVVHFPSGVFHIGQTINIPVAQNLALIGDGPLTVLSGSTTLVGPIVHVAGAQLQLENIQIAPDYGSTIKTGLEIDVDDQPSTTVHCDQCKTTGSQIAIQANGLDNASVDIRIGAINAYGRGALIVGGAARQSGYQTLGRVDAFMTSMDAYDVTSSGHFLIQDGWHDVGQGPVQFALTGSGVVTHQGGTIYTNAASSMTAEQFAGEISLLGIATDSTLDIDSASNAKAMSAGTVQITGRQLVTSDSQTSEVTELSNFSVVNNQTPTPFPNMTSPPSQVEHMFAQARTEYVVPRVPLSTAVTDITMHRVLVGGEIVGILLNPKNVIPMSDTYSIVSSVGTGQSTNGGSSACLNGDVSMEGKWSLQGEQDGFYGLKIGDSFLSNRPATPAEGNGLGLSQTMSDAGQRWILRPAGNGFFNIFNRASGEVLTSDLKGCASLSPETGARNQEWAVELLAGS